MKIEFVFTTDENGINGVLPKNYLNKNFDTFWNSQGIFHDIFEHFFEDKHKYFKGKYAFNIGGEIFASGIYTYIMETFYPTGRLFNSYQNFEEAVIGDCINLITDIKETEIYGSELLCSVPYQKPLRNTILENIIYSIGHDYPKDKKYITRLLRAGYRYGKRNYKRTNEAFNNIEETLLKLKKLTERNVESMIDYYQGFTVYAKKDFKIKIVYNELPYL